MLSLNRDELVLIAYLLTRPAPSETLDSSDYNRWASDWLDIKLDCFEYLEEWNRKFESENKKPHEVEVEVDWPERVLAFLATIVPPTWHWGEGPDCGYSLMSKLTRSLRGKARMMEF